MSSRAKKKEARRAAAAVVAAPMPSEDGLQRDRSAAWVGRVGRLASCAPRIRAVLASYPRTGHIVGALAIVVVVAAPMLFTNSGFAVDFTNHLWLTWVAGHLLVQAGHPTYFLNAKSVGVFYPWFAFYGGTLYMIVGGISELLGGHPVLAYVGITTLAIAASYLGVVSIGRQLGLCGWMSHAPALTVVTSAYYITNLYGRGAWTEFMATAAIPPLVASGASLARAPRWRPGVILVFLASIVIFSGSHNITLLWGTTVGVLAVAILWLAIGRGRPLPIRRLGALAALASIGVLVNSWYLVPDVGYASDISAHTFARSVAGASFFDAPGVLFNPLRSVPSESTTPALYVQIPVWFLAWSVIAGVVVLWRRPAKRDLRRAWLGTAILLCGLLGMLMITPLWSVMPFPFNEIQYPYRLGSYICYAIAGLVLVAALALQRMPAQMKSPATRRRSRQSNEAQAARLLRACLAAVCAISLGLCIWQEWVPNTLFTTPSGEMWSYGDRGEALAGIDETPRTWYDPGSYTDNAAPIVKVPLGRSLDFDPAQVKSDELSAWVQAPAGLAPIQTNIAGGSYLVHISGLRLLGRNREGYAVVRRETNGSGRVHVVLGTTRSLALYSGWILSVVACAAILLILVWSGARAVRVRRARAELTNAGRSHRAAS